MVKQPLDYHAELAGVAEAAAQLVTIISDDCSTRGGSLTVVGTGIRAIRQLSVETIALMARAEVLLHVIGESVQEAALSAINPQGETLTGFYVDGGDRLQTYNLMVQRILASVTAGQRTVVAFYGHPGVFTYPAHESVRRARAAGFPARMLPAISAEDCLFADLGIDPGEGCQSYDATDFVYRDLPFDRSAHLVLWQAGTLGNWTYESSGYDLRSFPALVYKLMSAYPPGHPAKVYEASFDPNGFPRIERLPISLLRGEQMTPASTLHVPPVRSR